MVWRDTVAEGIVRAALALTVLAAPLLAVPAHGQIVIAHRGASAERPEHTLAAYERAIDAGADYIEPDLVVTKDLHLVARHENELSDTTDVATREEFADRRKTAEIDGRLVSGWFAEDFTLAELRTLRAKERLGAMRRANMRYDGLYQVPTFHEIVTLVRAKAAENGRAVGLYPELKHPTYLLQQGIDSVDLFVRALRAEGLDGKTIPMFVQSFDVAPLKRLDRLTDLPLVQLVAAQGGPADEPDLTYAAMLAPAGLAQIAGYADAIGADFRLLIGDGGAALPVVKQARDAGLKVHAWTVRPENAFLPQGLWQGTDPAAKGCSDVLLFALRRAGVDGVFADDPRDAKQLLAGGAQRCPRVWTAMPNGAAAQ